jgi:hypothetical protein
VLVPECETRPSLMVWWLILESAVEGMTTLLGDAFCRRCCCRGYHDHDHILAAGSSELSIDVRHC